MVCASRGARTAAAGPTAAIESPWTSTTQPACVASLVASNTRSGLSSTGWPGGGGTSGANPARAGSFTAESSVSVCATRAEGGTANTKLAITETARRMRAPRMSHDVRFARGVTWRWHGRSASAARALDRVQAHRPAPGCGRHRGVGGDPAAARLGLQGLQELDDRVLLARRQVPESTRYRIRLAPVAQDRVAERQGRRIMHQPRAQAHAPQGSGTDLIATLCEAVRHELLPEHLIDLAAVVLRHRDRDPVSCADVVQQEVSERMEHLVAKCRRNRECAAVDRRAGRGRRQRADVAQRASNAVE